MSVARLQLAPVGETLFPPRSPFSIEPGEAPGSPEDPLPKLIGQRGGR
jgi:hypothetical protein